MSAADMLYTVGSVVFVRFRHKDNQVGLIHADDSNLVRKFYEFCEREGLINVGGGAHGPSMHVGYYTSSREGDLRTIADLTDLIIGWLDENGVTAKQEW